MAHVHASVLVPASPARTWETAADLSRFGEWLTLHDGWRSDLPDELGEGTTVTSVVSVMGLRNRVDWRIERYAPPKGLRITGTGVGGVRISLNLAVRPDGTDRATVTVDAEVTGGPVLGPIGLAIGRALRVDLRRSVAALADLLS
ncbi:toxin [Actinophytocola xinjiangensis]|uniref:Toxin n=1 Tax=Actinophytocola xinjiangensis TaxID=485602 RepID=A0A7Z0WS77_9PSEU|nr:SRPBCC family protein [Actinophytocola xinjiangensis]OLF13784.1 toxin [Actinophytocola xinjiangensis]